MNNITKRLITTGLIIAVLLAFAASSVFASQEEKEDKVNICHQTSSETNPWEAIQVNESAVQSHLDEHGDFLYDGPTDDKGKPDKEESDQWCGDNQPREEEPKDECKNIEGIQEEVPEGFYQDGCECFENEEEEPPVDEETPPQDESEATPSVSLKGGITELPSTGGLNLWLIGGIVVLLGAGIALYQVKK